MNLLDIALKNLNRRKGKLLLTVIGMVIGITTIITLSAVTDAMNTDLGDKFDQIGANIVITAKSNDMSLTYGGISVSGVSVESGQLDDSVPAKILTIPNKDNISVVSPKLITGTDVENKKALIVGVNFLPELSLKSWWNIRTVDKPEGTNPPLTEEQKKKRPERRSLPTVKADQVILGKVTADRLQKKPGDTIEILGKKFTVWGVIDPVGSTVDDSIHMDLKTTQELFQLKNQVSFIEVAALCTNCPIDDIIAQISDKLPDAEVSAVREAVKAREQTIEKFSDFVKGVSVIVLAIGSVVVMMTMLTSVNERTREIGILRAIGFRKSDVSFIILIESLILSLIAGLVGYLLGMGLAILIGPVIAQMDVTIAWNLSYSIVAVGLAVLVGLLASIIPAWKATTLDPVEALRFI